ncbi:MAG: DUF2155 domain-containing protein [Alphaproteobacteria bacterium]|nr:DUF2155 domain-containing protein [Alphaproteobacteria bacterium]
MARVKINYLFLVTALSWGLMCSTVHSAEINTNIARMQAMDKITGMVRMIDVPVNSEVKYGSLSIVVRACKTRPPEETPENFAFVDIVDNYKSENPVNIFRGWMISSSSSLNPLEHPIYDIWLLNCENGDVNPQLKIMTEEELKIREQIPQREKEVRDESKLKDEEEISTNTLENKEIGAALDVSAVQNEDETTIKSENQSIADTSVSVPSIKETTEEGPQALINIALPVSVEQKAEVQKDTQEAGKEKLAAEKSQIDTSVIITDSEIKNVEISEPLILQQEPSPEHMEDVVTDEAINTEEIEENGMLDDQLIDFSE